ncbi:hypothetical protein BX600DRAFT_490076 [Xylariales sp. PMI_506]|nr:hypothetical protein BX600DRAFT_490076 [Xylariales sp. PMI_506]
MEVAEATIYPVLAGKVAIITGGAQGMGRATAETFLKAGAKIVIADVQADKGNAVAAELSKLGDVTFIQTDISKSEQVQRLINETVKKYGTLDCAVNNAALTPDNTPLTDFDEAYWDKIMSINLTGTALCVKYEMQQMIKAGTKGSIVNIASINAFRPQPNMPAYTAAKHALIGLTKHASSEGGPLGIRINAIAPGAIYSEMSAAALEIMNTTEEEFAKAASHLHRFGKPHEIAQGSLWLCSNASSFLPSSSRVHEGKVALVTGSARSMSKLYSIGASIARGLASRGANLIINYATSSSDEAAAKLAVELQSLYNVKAITVKADVSKKAECGLIIEAAKAAFENPQTGKLQIDIIIHNAAILYVGPLEAVVEDEFHHIYAVNVLGPTLLTAACLPYLPTDRSGRIVLLSSINSKVGTPNTTLYAGTKGALEAMARVWCRELAERATVNTINPGPVMTDMYLAASEEVKQSLALWNPLTPLAPVRDSDSPEVQELGGRLGGRAAYAHEIANVVAMLCSPESAWTTGSLISCNGGLSFSY